MGASFAFWALGNGMRTRNFTLTVTGVTAAAIAAVALAGVPVFKGASSGLLVLDTLSAAASMLAALLVLGRFRRSALLADIALVWAFFALAVGNLLAAYVDPPQRVKLVSSALGSLAVLVAAGAQERGVGWRQVSRTTAVLAGLVAPALAVGGFVAIGEEVASGSSRTMILLLTATGFGTGAFAFTSKGERDGDALQLWLGAGCVVAAGSRLLYAMTSPAGDDVIHPADLGRLVFALFLVVGAVLEIRSYWRGVGVLEERRRLARELHDGMAQELSFIATETRRAGAAGPPDAITWYRISRAAERALDESRRAIHALISPMDQPLDEAVVATAEDVAAREGAEISFDVDDDVRVPGAVREALVRIVREAVANAARHGQAEVITVDLKVQSDGELRLRVSDDGCGFKTSAPVSNGRVGLTSMKERAAAVGGSLSVTSSPGGGTSVEVRVPSLN